MSSTTSRAPADRPALKFSIVEEAHTGLMERLAVFRPYRIVASRTLGIFRNAPTLEQVLGAVLHYVGAIVIDTSHVAPRRVDPPKIPSGLDL